MPAESDPLVIDGGLDSVARARRYAIERTIELGHGELVSDVELVTSELVSNALLHAGAPVTVAVTSGRHGVRIEVHDTGAAAPVRGLATTDSMTGRGLALVDAVSADWGAEQRPDGKVVWSELAAAGTDAGRSGLDSSETWTAKPRDDEPRFEVRVGDVPTDLLIAAKAHVDNLVRELTLETVGETGSGRAAVPSQLAELVESVVHGFAEARDAIKRQALDAAARGAERTHLVLRLPVSAIAAGEAYLAALDRADAYARAARLLTLETPPQHRAFRRWYVNAVIEQLRCLSAGDTPTAPPTLEQYLLDEVRVVAAAQRASDRAARLHAVAAALAGATTPADVANVAVAEGVAMLGADRGALLLHLDDDVTVPAAVGHTDVLQRVASDLSEPFPAVTALRTGEPVWVESTQERDERFPMLREVEPTAVAVCAYPLYAAGRIVGALRFSFDHPHLFDDDDRAFVAALGTQTGQSLDRSLLYVAEREARAAAEAYAARLARLQRVTSDLTAVNDVDAVAEVVVDQAAAAFGAYIATLSVVVDDHTLEVVRHSGSEQASQWTSYPIDASTPAGEAVLTNRPVVVRTGPDLDRRFPALAGRTPAGRSLACVPMQVGGRRIGVISLSFEDEERLSDPAELEFLTALADACSQAIDRAHALVEARESADKLAFLAEASVELSSTLDYRQTLTNVARLVVPRLADWCAIQLVNDDTLDTVAVAHIDPAKVAFAEELQTRYPPDMNADTGVPRVLRTGRGELYPVITREMLEAGAHDEEHLRISLELGLSSGIVAPLTGRSGTFGALTLIYAESGRHYTDSDLAFAEDLARRAAIAVENAAAFRQQSGQLARITRVAEAAQHAILAPVPDRVGPVRLAAAYASATREALVGGDLYEVVAHAAGTRLLIGDVRGKGLEAVRLATVVLGEFRAAAVERESLVDVARQMDRRLTAYLSDEDFVTALLAEVTPEGTCRLVSCGHHPALLAHDGRISELGATGSLPLGLGADPVAAETTLAPGDRLLMFTDGLIEARNADGRFADVATTVQALPGAPLATVLDGMLERLRAEVGGELGDDLALLVAEFAPADAAVPRQPAVSTSVSGRR